MPDKEKPEIPHTFAELEKILNAHVKACLESYTTAAAVVEKAREYDRPCVDTPAFKSLEKALSRANTVLSMAE